MDPDPDPAACDLRAARKLDTDFPRRGSQSGWSLRAKLRKPGAVTWEVGNTASEAHITLACPDSDVPACHGRGCSGTTGSS